MRIGIMGAMTQEIGQLAQGVSGKVVHTIGNRDFIAGTLAGHEVVVVFSRMGKVAAASTATTLINKFEVELLIFTGVAGAIDVSMNVGDIVVGNGFIQHDMDVSALPEFKRFEIPLLGRQILNPPRYLVEKAVLAAEEYISIDLPEGISKEKLMEFGIGMPKASKGLIGSGDQFIASVDAVARLREMLPELLCIEMEGAAVAQVAFEHQVPYVIIRTISDKADHSAHIDFPEFIRNVAAHFTCGAVMRLLLKL